MMLGVGVTADTVGGIGEIGTARDRIRLNRTRWRRQQQRRGGERSYCSFARKS